MGAHVTHGLGHGDRRARQGAVLAGEAVAGSDDAAPEQGEGRVRAGVADGRHGIAHQHQPLAPLEAQGQPKLVAADMVAVGDDPGKRRLFREGDAHRAGLARADLGHRVEQMGEAGEPLRHRRPDRGTRIRRMPGADPCAAGDEVCHRAGRHPLGRQRHQGKAARPQAGEKLGVAGAECGEPAGIVDADPLRAQERPLEMDAEDAGNACRDRFRDALDRRPDRRPRVGDEGGQQGSGAAFAVGGRDPGDADDARIVVEQHPAAAIDLTIDEARRQDRAGRQPHERHAGGRFGGDVGDPPAAQDDDAVAEHPLAVKDPLGGEGAMILRSQRDQPFGGVSGQRPDGISGLCRGPAKWLALSKARFITASPSPW
ncbi:hypothetical protein GCM10025880_19530 [Methylorubrum aminovorans]|nr:hypothetical protein GCM10025880_19530 [Methylorubrum aminovorans]